MTLAEDHDRSAVTELIHRPQWLPPSRGEWWQGDWGVTGCDLQLRVWAWTFSSGFLEQWYVCFCLRLNWQASWQSFWQRGPDLQGLNDLSFNTCRYRDKRGGYLYMPVSPERVSTMDLWRHCLAFPEKNSLCYVYSITVTLISTFSVLTQNYLKILFFNFKTPAMYYRRSSSSLSPLLCILWWV